MKHKNKKIERQFKAQKQDKSSVNQKQQKCGAVRRAESLGLLAAAMGQRLPGLWLVQAKED